MMEDSKKIENDRLLALYANAKDNLNFLKNRASFVLASYTAIVIFLIRYKDSSFSFLEPDLVSFWMMFGGHFLFVLLYKEINRNIQKHRNRIKSLVKKFQTGGRSFLECYGDRGPGFDDRIWSFVGAGYLALMFVITGASILGEEYLFWVVLVAFLVEVICVNEPSYGAGQKNLRPFASSR